MIEMKEELKAEIESGKRREKTIEGTIPRSTTVMREIFDELAKSGPDGEKLASAFRKTAGKQTIVSSLNRARREGKLVDKARELLSKEETNQVSTLKEKTETRLKRICWCWIQP
jgi:hypothetical protein